MSAAPRRILLGVTGSIAAYKTPQLIRDLVRTGAEVRVAMTRSATAFVTPLTLATVSHNAVVIDPLPTDAGDPNAGTWHIDLARWAEVMLIAPASANTLAKLAHGRADSAVTMLALALPCPLMIAPAMDEDMLLHAATQSNLDVLHNRGVEIIEPDRGSLASGIEGEGRLAALDEIVARVQSLLATRGSLTGVKIVVTAGPTHEPIDPVRFIGNRSSGKMGFAIAEEAALRGADVTLIAGPASLRTPTNVLRLNVETAKEMLAAVQHAIRDANALIMAAAVADYAVKKSSAKKLKKSSRGLQLDLVSSPDTLKIIATAKGKRVHVGFALETENGMANARKKLQEKRLDMIVLNAATGPDIAIGTDENTITIIDRMGTTTAMPRMSKRKCAAAIIDHVRALIPNKS